MKGVKTHKEMRPCEWCGRPFLASKSSHVICSGRCNSARWRAATKVRMLACKLCGTQFQARTSNHIYCSDACATGANARRLQAQNSGAGKHWSKGMEYVPRRTCELCGKRFYAAPIYVRRGGARFCSNDCRTRNVALHPELYPQVRTRRAITGRRADLNNRFFRSTWEANYARYLNWLISVGDIKSWEYEVDTFEFIAIKRGTRFYTPDFKVTERNGTTVYHEVKGWMDPKSKTRLARMAKYYPAVKLILIDKDAYYAIAKTAKHLVSNWETQSVGRRAS